VTRLRKIMLEELQRRNYSEITTRKYLRVVTDFARYFGKSPDKLGPNELRSYQAYLLKERKLTPGTASCPEAFPIKASELSGLGYNHSAIASVADFG
jgi:integrase-like protein